MDLAPLYSPDRRLELHTHAPPEPFGKCTYKHQQTPNYENLTPEHVGHLMYDDVLFARHPRERHEPSIVEMPDWFTNSYTRLRIEYQLSEGAAGAQVVLCSVEAGLKQQCNAMGHQEVPEMVVAKIFDPLHYFDHQDMVAEADREYAQEAAAYIHLHNMRDTEAFKDKADMVPKFYGTWTTNITRKHLITSVMTAKARNKEKKRIRKEQAQIDAAAAKEATSGSGSKRLEPQAFRPVRIILLEFVDAPDMAMLSEKMDSENGNSILQPCDDFEDQEKRNAIFTSILDTVARTEHLGIAQLKIEPDNLLITEDEHVVMTDFSQADVAHYTNIGYQVQEKLSKPLHPMHMYSIDNYLNLAGWFPPEWYREQSLFRTWVSSAFPVNKYADEAELDQVYDHCHWDEELPKHGLLPTQESMEQERRDFFGETAAAALQELDDDQRTPRRSRHQATADTEYTAPSGSSG